MRDEWTGHFRPETGPELWKCRFVCNISFRDTVDGDIERIEVAWVGPDQLTQAPSDLAILDHHQAYSADGTSVRICRLEINGGEFHILCLYDILTDSQTPRHYR